MNGSAVRADIDTGVAVAVSPKPLRWPDLTAVPTAPAWRLEHSGVITCSTMQCPGAVGGGKRLVLYRVDRPDGPQHQTCAS